MAKQFGLFIAVVMIFSMVPSVQAMGIERPTTFVRIDKTLQSANNSSDKAVVGLGVDLHSYYPEEEGNTNNMIGMNLSVIGNTRTGVNYTSYDQAESIPVWMTENCPQTNLNSVPQNFTNLINGTRYFFPDTKNENWSLGAFRLYGSDYVTDSSRGLNCSVWISTNGFLSFDLSSSNLTCPLSFPSVASPTAVIAPLWTNMTMDASSTIITMSVANETDPFHFHFYFVVIWKNMLHGMQRLTFSVALGLMYQGDEGLESTKSGDIIMAYENVANIGSFAHGIEDMTGKRGVGCLESSGSNWLSSHNGKYLVISQTTNNVYIRNIGLQIWDNTTISGLHPSNVAYRFVNYPGGVEGYNVQTNPGSHGDSGSNFTISLHQAVSALSGLGGIAHGIDVLAAEGALALASQGTSLLVSAALVAWGFYDMYQQNQYNNIAGMTYQDSYGGGHLDNSSAWVDAPANGSVTVDASLCTQFLVYLQPYNDFTVSHNVTIGGFVEYQEYPDGNLTPVYTNTTFSVDATSNHGFDTATKTAEGNFGNDPMLWLAQNSYDNADYYNMSLYQDDRVNLTMTSPATGGFNLYVFAPNNRITPAFSNGSQGDPVSINFNSTMAGWWTIKINGTGQGFYNWTLDIQGLCDFNNDDTVDIFDAIMFARHFNTQRGYPGYWAAADLNNDGTIDVYDAIIFANHFLQTEWIPPAGSGGCQLQKPQGRLMQGAFQTAVVAVSPTQTTVFKGETFNVSVGVSSVTDLNGWQFGLYWDSTVLNCTSAAAQSPTEWGNNTLDFGPGLQSNYNSTHSRYLFARAVTDEGSPFNGSTTLATLSFQAVGCGTTSLSLADVALGNSTAQPIDFSTAGGSVTVCYGRYMRGDTQSVNGLSAYNLTIPQSASSAVNTQGGSGIGATWGIRAWVRHSNGVEQEISLDGQTGAPKATVGGGAAGIKSNTVSVAQTSLQSTDSLVIRVYLQIADGPWNLCATFTTEQLQSGTLQATFWTMYYYTYSSYNRIYRYTTASFYWGTATYNSRLQNLQFS